MEEDVLRARSSSSVRSSCCELLTIKAAFKSLIIITTFMVLQFKHTQTHSDSQNEPRARIDSQTLGVLGALIHYTRSATFYLPYVLLLLLWRRPSQALHPRIQANDAYVRATWAYSSYTTSISFDWFASGVICCWIWKSQSSQQHTRTHTHKFKSSHSRLSRTWAIECTDVRIKSNVSFCVISAIWDGASLFSHYYGVLQGTMLASL